MEKDGAGHARGAGDTMFGGFLKRKRENKKWFRIESGFYVIEGQKMPTGDLDLTVSIYQDNMQITVNNENVYKLIDWLQKSYPRKGVNNVVSIVPVERSLSLRDTERDPGTSA